MLYIFVYSPWAWRGHELGPRPMWNILNLRNFGKGLYIMWDCKFGIKKVRYSDILPVSCDDMIMFFYIRQLWTSGVSHAGRIGVNFIDIILNVVGQSLWDICTSSITYYIDNLSISSWVFCGKILLLSQTF